MKIGVVHSGTSADAIDVACIDITTNAATGITTMVPEVLTDTPWPERLREHILAVSLGGQINIADVARLDVQIAEAFADALMQTRCEGMDLIVAPGQTVYHWVDGGRARGTLQLGRSAVIAERTGAAVVSDLRAADIAAGGNGAPLMPVFDGAWLGDEARQSGMPIATLNLGGIANISRVEADGTVSGWDTGPANGLLDAVIARASAGELGFDEGGARAASGRVDRHLLRIMEGHPYFARPTPKSTGRETFDLSFVDEALRMCGHDVPLDDILATLVQLTARTIAASLKSAGGASTLIVSGGGVRNPVLLSAISDVLAAEQCSVVSSAERGIEPAHKESLLFALVGYCSAHGLPITLDARVGARVAGMTTPAGWAPTTRVAAIGKLRIHERNGA